MESLGKRKPHQVSVAVWTRSNCGLDSGSEGREIRKETEGRAV